MDLACTVQWKHLPTSIHPITIITTDFQRIRYEILEHGTLRTRMAG